MTERPISRPVRRAAGSAAALLIVLVLWGRAPAAAAPAPRDTPGQTSDGRVRLPNGWFLSPAGKQVKVGDFPMGLAISPDGKLAAVTHSGAYYGAAEPASSIARSRAYDGP